MQSFTMNEYQVASLGIGKANGNWTQVHLVKAEVMEAVTWYEDFKYDVWTLKKGFGMLDIFQIKSFNI